MLFERARIAFLYAAAMTLFGIAAPVSGAEGASASSPAVPVFYDPALAAKGFPNPLVTARIAGHEATFIVDTGASTHVLADWYVEAAGIPSTKTDTTARGSGGQTVPVRRVERIEGRWSDGQQFTLNEGIVVTFPPFFKELRIGGLVSPQFLGPAGMAAVFDLSVPSLRFAPYARALSDLRSSEATTGLVDVTQPCGNASSTFANRQYVAPVTTAGVTELMQVDTGATDSIFSQDSKIARAIESRSEASTPSQGVGGEVNARRMVRDVQLLRGGQVVTLNPGLGAVSAGCEAKGLLGMDALRGCSLILGDTEMAVSCRPEDARLLPASK